MQNTESIGIHRARFNFVRLLRQTGLLVLALGAIVLWSSPASAQTIRFRSNPFRMTIPALPIGVLTNDNITVSNWITFPTNTSNNITFAVTGLPANIGTTFIFGNGASAPTTNDTGIYVTNNPFNVFPFFIVNGDTNAQGTPNTLRVRFTYTNVTEGIYPLVLSASGGATGSIPLILQSAFIWNGATNSRVFPIDLFSNPASWTSGSAAPGSGDDVVFNDQGGQTNPIFVNTNLTFLTGTNYTNFSLSFMTNIYVSANATVKSIRFSQTRGVSQSHVLSIGTGNILRVIGTNDFGIFPDTIPGMSTGGGGSAPTLTVGNVWVQGQGTLAVTNDQATFLIQVGASQGNSTTPNLTMSNLDNFIFDGRRVAIGDYRAFPWELYRNYNDQNGFGGVPRAEAGAIWFAKTNFVKARYADPANYTNVADRVYSMTLCNNEASGTTGANPQFQMGISNAFYMDSVCFVGCGGSTANARMGFNNVFRSNNPTAYFRNVDGISRMSVFVVSDFGGTTNGAQTNMKGTADFGSGNGYVDILADRLYVGRDRILIPSNQAPNVQANLAFGKGKIDVNTAIVGFQEHSGQTNWQAYYPDTLINPYLGWVQGQMQVTNGGTFKANKYLVLGYTADTNDVGQAHQFNTHGQFTLDNSSTGMVNYIFVDPATGQSGDNSITLDHNSNLIISNSVADPAVITDPNLIMSPNLGFVDPTNGSKCKVSTLSVGNGSVLTVQLDGNRAAPYIYVTNVTTPGGGNLINIASIANPNSYSFPVVVDVISYENNTASFGARAFAPYNVNVGRSTPSGAGTIQITISTNPPKHLFWRGTASANWNSADKNWFDPATGLITNFANPDYVEFEDKPGFTQTNVTVAEAGLQTSGMNVTNGVNVDYNFLDGGGGFGIVGTATLTNHGPGKLTVNAKTQLSVEHDAGTLAGSGTLSDVTARTNTIMFFSGTISSGVSSAGTNTLLNPGSIAGGFVLQAPGVLTNYGTIDGNLSVASGTVLYNANGALLKNFNTVTFPTNSLVINAGNIGLGENVSVATSGELDDMGSGAITVTTLTINGGNTNGAGFFKPGGGGLATTTITPSGVSTLTAPFPGRILMSKNSTNIFAVDMSQPQTSTRLDTRYCDFGGSQSNPGFNGATLLINNIGAAFTAGQEFRIAVQDGVNNFAQDGSSSNCYPQIVPNQPGPGLTWDVSSLTGTGPGIGSYTNGLIKIRAVATSPGPLTNFTLIKTNYGSNAANTQFLTNNQIISHLTWGANYIGWGLEQQQNATKFDAGNPNRTLGISSNWSLIFDSVYTNDLWFTNDYASNQCGFFRLIFPIPDVDKIGVTQ